MTISLRTLLPLVSLLLLPALLPAADDWPAWRGPNGNGVAAAGQRLPVRWSETENVQWAAEVPGRGHSSPVVVGEQVLLTAADEERQIQSVLSFDRRTGRQLWNSDVSSGGFPESIHKKNTHASPTIAVSGARLFALFHNHDSAQLTALGLDGGRLWQIEAGGHAPQRFRFGFAPSPLVHGSLVIVASEYEQGWLAAFDQETGEEVWRVARTDNISYSSPIVGHFDGRDQLLLSGGERITSYDPQTGHEFWAAAGCSTATCGTVVWEKELVFASGGFPQKETIAIRADGSGEVAWKNGERCYEQSLLVHEGYLYAVTDSGIAFCWRASDGQEMWKQRLSGPVSASPTLGGGSIYASNERGRTFVFRPDPDRFDLIAENDLGDEAFASPTICGDRIFLRVAHHRPEGRVEMLYCLGATESVPQE